MCRVIVDVKARVIHLQQFESDRAIGTPGSNLNDVQIGSYAGNAQAGPVARIDTVDLVRVVYSRLKTRRDARPCWYVAAEATLLKVSSWVSATDLDNSRYTQTAVP
jgi:hypothetical protein